MFYLKLVLCAFFITWNYKKMINGILYENTSTDINTAMPENLEAHNRLRRYLVFEDGASFVIQGNFAKAFIGERPRGLVLISEYSLTYALPTSMFVQKSKEIFYKSRRKPTTPTTTTTTTAATTKTIATTQPWLHWQPNQTEQHYYYHSFDDDYHNELRNAVSVPTSNVTNKKIWQRKYATMKNQQYFRLQPQQQQLQQQQQQEQQRQRQWHRQRQRQRQMQRQDINAVRRQQQQQRQHQQHKHKQKWWRCPKENIYKNFHKSNYEKRLHWCKNVQNVSDKNFKTDKRTRVQRSGKKIKQPVTLHFYNEAERIFFDLFGKLAEMHGYNSRYCIMRTLCESQHLLLPKGYSLLHDLVRILINYALPAAERHPTFRSSIWRANLTDCADLYGPHCRLSLLQHFTTAVHGKFM